MSKAIKTKVTIHEGQAAVVADLDTWRYLDWVFMELAQGYPIDSVEYNGWVDLCEHISVWVSKTAFYDDDEEEATG